MPRISVLLAPVFAASLLAAVPAHAIVGGEPASRDYPHMAAMEFRTDEGAFEFICGGSLVRPDVVLTAAHCVVDEPDPSRYRFVLGTRNRTKGGEIIGATKVVPHPEYDDESAANDVALLKLEKPSTRGRPIPLGTADRLRPGDTATIIGYGATMNGGPPVDELREGQVPIVSDDECAQNYAVTAGFDPASQFCAGFLTGGEDSCQGDSGGPIMVPAAGGGFVLLGDVSFGVGCALPTQYGVYAEVVGAKLRPFVEAKLDELSPPPPLAKVGLRLSRLRATVVTSRPLTGLKLTLRRGSRTIARGTRRALASKGTVRLRKRRGFRAGKATLRLTATDDAGRAVSARRRVTVRR